MKQILSGAFFALALGVAYVAGAERAIDVSSRWTRLLPVRIDHRCAVFDLYAKTVIGPWGGRDPWRCEARAVIRQHVYPGAALVFPE